MRSTQAKHADRRRRSSRSASALANLGGNPNIAPERHPAVQQAQARLDRAQLDLSYTVVSAPSDGVVARVEQLQVGDYIAASAPVFALVSTARRLDRGQLQGRPARTHARRARRPPSSSTAIRAGPSPRKVASVSPGTGSQFSLLPPENATGNWVKVVQRVPVRVQLRRLEPALSLHAGLSADVSVDTQHRAIMLRRRRPEQRRPERRRGERCADAARRRSTGRIAA